MNDTTVWCQSRGVTEPAGETKSRFSHQKKKVGNRLPSFFVASDGFAEAVRREIEKYSFANSNVAGNVCEANLQLSEAKRNETKHGSRSRSTTFFYNHALLDLLIKI